LKREGESENNNRLNQYGQKMTNLLGDSVIAIYIL